MMSAYNQLQPYRFFNKGALIGLSAATLYILLGLWFFPALLALPMGLGWLGIIGLSGVATPIIINYLRPTRVATPAVFIVFGALAVVASACTMHLLPPLVSSILCLSAAGFIGGVIGSGIFECISTGWRNFFNSEYEPIAATFPDAEETHTTKLVLISLSINTAAPATSYQVYQADLRHMDSDNDEEDTKDLQLSRTEPHSGVRILRYSSGQPIEIKDEDDFQLESDEEDEKQRLTVESGGRYQTGPR